MMLVFQEKENEKVVFLKGVYYILLNILFGGDFRLYEKFFDQESNAQFLAVFWNSINTVRITQLVTPRIF